MTIEKRPLADAERIWTDSIFRAYYRRIKVVAFQLGKNRYHISDPEDWAEDITQDVFLCLTDHIAEKDLMHHPNIGGWLMETLKGKIGNYIQKQGNWEITFAEPPLVSKKQMCYEDKYEDGDSLFPQGMTEKEKLIIYRRICEERSCKEVAKELGISSAGCAMQLHRALKKFKQLKKNQLNSTKFDSFRQRNGSIVQKGGVEHV